MSRWPLSLYNDAAESIDRRRGWDKLPRPIAMLVLIGLRNRLREKNLYDTGRGPLDLPDVADHPRPPDRAHARRHLQRPRRPADGRARQPLRPQRPARAHRSRAGRPAARAEPAPRQPRAADARRVQPGDDAQPARRRVDPVRGARLVQPRQEREPRTRGASRSTARRPWPEHPMRIERTRRDPSARSATGRRPSSPTTRTGGTARRSTAATRRSPQAIRDGRARQAAASTPRGCSRRTIEAHVDLTGVAGNFWVGLALLHTLFMREHNAICDRLHADAPRAGRRRRSSRRRGWSTPR